LRRRSTTVTSRERLPSTARWRPLPSSAHLKLNLATILHVARAPKFAVTWQIYKVFAVHDLRGTCVVTCARKTC
jgi:hypothetical protein